MVTSAPVELAANRSAYVTHVAPATCDDNNTGVNPDNGCGVVVAYVGVGVGTASEDVDRVNVSPVAAGAGFVTHIRKMEEIFEEVIPLIPVMQRLFRDWSALDQRKWEGVSVLSKEFRPYIEAQSDMARPAEGDEVYERSRKNVKTVKAAALWIFHKAASNLPEQPDENRPSTFARSASSPNAGSRTACTQMRG